MDISPTPHANNMGGLNSVRGFNHHLKSLNQGIDTLEVGFNIVLKKRGSYHDIEAARDFWFMLERAKADISDNANSSLFTRLHVPNSDFIFSIQRFGSKPYTYLMKSQYCDISFATRPDVTHMPPIHVRFGAWGLASFTVGALIKALKMAFSPWFNIEVSAISRLDYFLDFCGYDFTAEDINNFVSRAKFRPVYPNTQSPETFQFGKGSIVLRIYNKSKEIIANPSKAWTTTTWLDYRGETDVWRVEYQMRREFLKQFNIHTLERFNDDKLLVLAYCTNWVRHSFECSKSNHDATPANSLIWNFVTENLCHGISRRVRPAKVINSELKSITQSVMGLLVSAGVCMDSDNLQEVLHRVIEDSEHYSDFDFGERVKQRALDRGKPLSLNGKGASS